MSPIIFIVLPILLFSVIIHECAHGIAAYRCGDDTAKLMGRITLNPIPHIDPFWSIIIPLIMIISYKAGIFIPLIAGAKPIPVNPLNFKRPRRDDIIVSAAGISSNILLAITAGLLLIAFVNFPMISIKVRAGFGIFFLYVVLINFWLATFNLIPLPPLDGSHILANVLPYTASKAFRQINPLIGMIILILLISSGLLGYIFLPILKVTLSFIDLVTSEAVLNEMSKFLK